MGYDLTVTGPQTLALFDLRGDRAALDRMAGGALPPWPARPCSLERTGERALAWVGPGRWLLIAPMTDEDALEAALCRDYRAEAGITLVSDALGFFTLRGGDAGVAMSIACPLDLHPYAFAPDGVALTDAFGVRALVLRLDDGWMIGVEPAQADYVAAHLAQIRQAEAHG